MGEMGNANKILVGKLEGKIYVDGRIILKLILRKSGGKVDWIHLALVRVQWRALENTDILVP
jgi:hypothetical protein